MARCWDMDMDPPLLFADCKMHLPVPHTYRVQGCPSCSGAGHAPCSKCRGAGTSTCIFCGGSGGYTNNNDIYSDCPHCKNSGQMSCFSYRGEGQVPCAWCGAQGLLLCRLELTVTWKNGVAEYVVNKNQGFPLSCFQEVTGKQLFSQEHHLVTLLNFPQPVTQGAESCLALHQMQVLEETRMLSQHTKGRHSSSLCPSTPTRAEHSTCPPEQGCASLGDLKKRQPLLKVCKVLSVLKGDLDPDPDPKPGRSLTPPAPPGRLGDRDWLVQGRGAKPLPPPLDPVGEPREQRSRLPFMQHSVPPVTEAAARRALLRFVASRCCYGSRAAGALAIRRLRQLGTYRYRLETFSESRLSEWAFEPFTKPGAAGPPGDAPLDPWDVEVGPPPLFQGQTRRCRVPGSALVRDCHRCHGHGRSKCGVCHGAGRTRCVTCKGSRQRLKQQKRCQLCSGTGRKRCNTCSGRGSKTCATCQGEKKLQHFKQLVIRWKNNVFEFVSEHHLNFPRELLSKVSGENIFKDENVVVYPIIDFPDPEISLASQRAVAEHSAAFATSSRILRQRQTIELIPITEVHCQYSGKPYLYYIYGLENQVHALDYPERCCCGCTVA